MIGQLSTNKNFSGRPKKSIWQVLATQSNKKPAKISLEGKVSFCLHHSIPHAGIVQHQEATSQLERIPLTKKGKANSFFILLRPCVMVCFNFTPPITTKLRFTEPTKSRRKQRLLPAQTQCNDCVSQRPALKTNSADFATDRVNSQHSHQGLLEHSAIFHSRDVSVCLHQPPEPLPTPAAALKLHQQSSWSSAPAQG